MINDNATFNEMVESVMTDRDSALLPVIEKEILHYEIFAVLIKHGLLSDLTFQGGTSLRLLRGSNRYSEDLDFAGGSDYPDDKKDQIKAALENDIGERLGLDVRVKAPKENKDLSGVKVDKWQASIETHPERPDIPKQKIKIEIASVPAYTSELLPLTINYPAMTKYNGLFVNAETINEVLADKLIAFPMSGYIRHRDAWDIPWLIQNGASINNELLLNKITDYNNTIDEFVVAVDERLRSLTDIVKSGDFEAQMSRFIEPRVIEATLNRPGFLDYIENTVADLLNQSKTAVTAQPDDSEDDSFEFKM
jgi:predicted nucleotidyltransferase component of viral defense system